MPMKQHGQFEKIAKMLMKKHGQSMYQKTDATYEKTWATNIPKNPCNL